MRTRVLRLGGTRLKWSLLPVSLFVSLFGWALLLQAHSPELVTFWENAAQTAASAAQLTCEPVDPGRC